jgi:hypothetical protein
MGAMMRFIWVWTKCAIGLAAIAITAYVLITWQRSLILAGDWQEGLVFLTLLIVGGYFYELLTTGEIRFSATRAWRPKRPIEKAPHKAASIVELHPHEYRREH